MEITLTIPDELARRVKPLFQEAGLWRDEYLGNRHAWFFAVLELLKPRAKLCQRPLRKVVRVESASKRRSRAANIPPSRPMIKTRCC